jgi:hypothetical protein
MARRTAGEEALGLKAIAIGSGLKLMLDEEEVTVEWFPSSDDDGERWRWPATTSRGERPGAERSEACTQRKESGGGALTVPTHEDKAACPRGMVLTGGDQH